MDSSRLKLLLKEIRNDIKNKSFSEARAKGEEILNSDSKNYMALLLMGASYQEQDKEKAATYLRRAVKESPEAPTVALQGLSSCAEIEELPAIFSKLLALVPEKWQDYHKKLLDNALSNNVLKIATETFEIFKSEVTQDSSRKTSSLKALIYLHLKYPTLIVENGIFKEALECALEDKEHPQHCNVFKRYLKLLYNSKLYPDLILKAKEMTVLYPEDVYPLEWLCKVFMENEVIQSDFLEIETFATDLLNLNEKSGLAALVKALFSYKKGDFFISRELATKSLIELGSYSPAFKIIADCNYEIGAYQMSVNFYRKSSYFPESYFESLSFSNETKSLEESLKYFESNGKNNMAVCRASHFLNKEVDLKMLTTKEKFIFENIYLNSSELSKDESYEGLLAKGVVTLRQKDYNSSLNHFLKATRLKPFRSECFLGLGKVYLAVEDFVRARKCFEKTISLDPLERTAIEGLSFLLKKNNEMSSNEILLEKTLSHLSPTQTHWVHFQLGLHTMAVQKFSEAIHHFRTALRYEVNNIIYWESLADAYFERGSFSSAMKVYQKIIEINPKNKYAKLQIAIIKSTTSMDYDAIKCFDELIEENPDYIPARKGAAEAHYNLFNYNLTLKLFGRAKDHLQKAIEHLETVLLNRNQNMIWLWRLTGYIFYSAARIPDSLAFLEVSGKLVSKETENKVVSVGKKELFNFAAKFLTCALKLSPTDSNLWYDLSLCNYHTGVIFPDQPSKFDLALKACMKSLQIQPTMWKSWNLLGVLNTSSTINNLPMAQHCFIKALNLERKSAMVWSNLGSLYLKLEEIKLANEAFLRAQHADPNYLCGWMGQAMVGELIIVDELEVMDLFRHCTQLDFHVESALGYAHWVCSILSDDKKVKKNLYKYAIETMNAVPLASDSMTWYVRAEDDHTKVDAYSYLGYLFANQKLWNAARKVFIKALEKCSDQEEKDKIRSNIGNILLKMDKPLEASEYFNCISKATFKSTIGLALAYYRANQLQESYSVYSSALEWLATSEEEKSLILIAMSAMVYAFQGEADTKTILYQSISLKNCPVQAFYSTCALGILHGDIQLSQTILQELSKIKDTEETSHHVAFLTAQVYKSKGEEEKGLTYLVSKVHMYPNRALLRKVLADYLLENFSHMRKYHQSTSQIALSVIALGLKDRKNIQTAKAAAETMLKASAAIKPLDSKKSIIYIQRAIHLNPSCEEAWRMLKSVKC